MHHAHYAVSTPIVQTSNYYFNNTQEVYDFMKAKSEGKVIREHEYGRYGNPTQTGVRTQACRHRGRRARGAVLHAACPP